MKKNYLLSIILVLSLCGISRAQMVGTNTFLQGRWLEIGLQNNGAFGANTPPAGYHPFAPGTGWLAEVYDLGHDGWTVGVPTFNGDYTYPGSPFEGWELQVNGQRNQCFQGSGIIGTGSLTGSSVSYSNAGGIVKGNWQGTASATNLQVFQETRVDTLASWVVVTTRFKNVGLAAIPGIYYLRSCDPDNDQAHGGAFNTNNTIVHQNEDARHRVQVNAQGLSYSDNLGLCTKDCRAKAFIYTSWSIGSGVDLAGVWGGSSTGLGTAQFLLNGTLNGDYGIGLVYNVGTINAGDSAIISYAYYFNNLTGVDSAFPDPKLVVNGVGMPVIPPPTPNNDTIDVCGLGLTTIPANILYASDKCWSWSKWTWSPALGLATTTGVNNTINTTILPATFTYTITGTDSAFGMASCNNKTFYLTIKTCNNITINTPCVGDTMKFNAPGDSTGATYQWYGPAPSTAVFATTQSAFKFPTTWADTGLYHVIKTVAGVPDTAFTYAYLYPLPVISGTLSICLGTTSSLTSNITGGTWTSLNPSVATVSSTGVVTSVSQGTATIINTSPAGCKSSVVVTVFVLAPVIGPGIVCQGSSITLTDSIPGGVWTSSNTGVAIVGGATGVVTGMSGGTSMITYSVGGCLSTKIVSVTPTSPITGTAEMCQYFTTTLGNAYTGGVWSSGATAVATVNATTGIVGGITGGTATIYYTLNSCTVSKVVTVHAKPVPPTVTPDAVCQFSVPNPFSVTAGGFLPGATLTWYGPGVTPGSTVPPLVPTDSATTVHAWVTQTSVYGCVSDSAHIWRVVKPQPPAPGTEDLKYCQGVSPVVLNADAMPGATLNWYLTASGGTAVPTPTPSAAYVGATTYYVSQTLNGCEGPRGPLKVDVIYKPDFTITATNGKVCQHDSLTFTYTGPALVNPSFAWELPVGAAFVNGSSAYDATVTVRFDTTWGSHIVKLTAWNLKDQCSTTMPIEVNVIPQPAAYAFTKLDVCIHDTVSLALQGRTTNAEEFLWWIDGTPMQSSADLNIVTANVKTGGPYLISWNKAGHHVVSVKAMADNECPAKTTSDTINVHDLPNASFKFDTLVKGRLCLEDSIIFSANFVDYNCKYEWMPAHFFDNLNKPSAWGRIGQNNSVITLKVTDPFGCVGKDMQEFTANSCCKVTFPTAFTPNDDGHNDKFRPIFAGFHKFHTFKVTNRWGQVLFESSNNNPAWDGYFSGVPQDMGVYFYYIKYDCGGKTLEEKGEITLVR